MTTTNDVTKTEDEPRIGEFLAECPECGATAIGNEDFTPGHMHDLDSVPTFFQYEKVDENAAPTRRRRRQG